MIESLNIQKNQGEFYKFDYTSIISQAIQYLINTSKSQTISFTCKSLKKRVREESGIVLSGCKIRFGLYELLSKYRIKIDRSRQKYRYFLDNPIFKMN
ncbi:hypothetical protein DSAG12_04395 [Promethearchaeum syntrophicum]|uniref:Uncharacterized protein n=1 Tax=Promethearchaeum syntrophicum TaxID=2594042 RepID=A0AC61ZU30_9ARCH